jgi:hypothetical protein
MMSHKISICASIVAFILMTNVSCSPKMHLVGMGMRQINISQNKYSKYNPYYETRKSKKKKNKHEEAN